MTTPDTLFPVPEAIAQSAWVDAAGYERLYTQSIQDPEGFLGRAWPALGVD